MIITFFRDGESEFEVEFTIPLTLLENFDRYFGTLGIGKAKERLQIGYMQILVDLDVLSQKKINWYLF